MSDIEAVGQTGLFREEDVGVAMSPVLGNDGNWYWVPTVLLPKREPQPGDLVSTVVAFIEAPLVDVKLRHDGPRLVIRKSGRYVIH